MVEIGDPFALMGVLGVLGFVIAYVSYRIGENRTTKFLAQEERELIDQEKKNYQTEKEKLIDRHAEMLKEKELQDRKELLGVPMSVKELKLLFPDEKIEVLETATSSSFYLVRLPVSKNRRWITSPAVLTKGKTYSISIGEQVNAVEV